jgi:flagellar hook assembly protein FlgD
MKYFAIIAVAAAGITIFGTVSSFEAKKDDAVRILEDTHNVKVTSIGYAMYGCGEEDNFSFKWKGVNEDGKEVQGNACSGFLKGTTIRFK